MALYRLLFLREGEITGQHSRYCSDDQDAFYAAWQVSDEYGVEVYQGERLVAHVMRRGQHVSFPARQAGYSQ